MPFASSNQRTYRDCHPERSVSERAFSSAREQDPRDLLRCTQGFLDHVYIYLLIVGYQLPREPGDPQSRFLVPTRALVNARARFTGLRNDIISGEQKFVYTKFRNATITQNSQITLLRFHSAIVSAWYPSSFRIASVCWPRAGTPAIIGSTFSMLTGGIRARRLPAGESISRQRVASCGCSRNSSTEFRRA